MNGQRAFAEDLVEAFLDKLTSDPRSAARLRALFLAPPQVTAAVCTKQECAASLRISPATLDRAVRNGCPVEHVGAKRRFDVEKVRAWFAVRGRARARPDDEDPVDVNTSLERHRGRRRRSA